MTSLQIVFFIITASTIFSIIYLIIAINKKSAEMKINSLIMLLCPLAGPVYYLGQSGMQLLLRKEKGLPLEDIAFSKERHNRLLRPNADIETQTVPLEEVFLVSDEVEKRTHLLSELKRDYIANYKIIIKALSNEDSETSHYAASAIANAKAEFENDLRELDTLYNRNKEDLELVRRYVDYVHSYLRSEILDSMEMRKYSYLLINLLSNVASPEKFLTEKDYTHIVNEAIALGEFGIAEHWAAFSREILENESSYLNLLKVYYYTNQTEPFLTLLDDMKKSDILLSHKGLSLVRFYMRQ